MKNLFLLLVSFASILIVNSQDLTPNVVNASTDGMLTVSVTTAAASSTSQGYSPENVIALWVQDNAGKLVNTMMYYTTNSNSSALDMSVWWNLIGSHWSTNAATLATYTLKNVDGISGATQKTGATYGSRTCYWGKTVSLSAVPDGVYTVGMELNDIGPAAINAVGHKVATFSFTKGPVPQTLTPADVLPSFKSISIQWTPKNTGIDAVKLANQYKIYPNPTHSKVFVSGNDILEIELCTLDGKDLFKTNQQMVNLSVFAKGVYLVKVITKKGTFVKKVEKI